MFENGADDRRVLDAADDPHGSLAVWTNQRVNFIYFLNQSRPVPPEGLFISLRFEDTGDGIVNYCFNEVSGTFGERSDKNLRLPKAYENC